MENSVFISVGANIGDRELALEAAVKTLADDQSISLVSMSSIYETDPVGFEDQPLFLNMVIEIMTNYSAEKLLDILQQIEGNLGRTRAIYWGPRTIDLDILLFNHENIETERLKIPHPRMYERGFVMVPLLEIYPELEYELADEKGVRLWKRNTGEDVLGRLEN